LDEKLKALGKVDDDELTKKANDILIRLEGHYTSLSWLFYQ